VTGENEIMKRIVCVVVSMGLMAGCNPALLAEMGVLQRSSTKASAPNPIAKGSEAPLTASAQPAQPMLRTHGQPEMCDRGPFSDAYAVSLSKEKVCVSVKRAFGGSPGSLEASATVEVKADGATRKVKIDAQGDAEKVGACTPGPRASYGPFEVYVRDFKGCIANDGFVSESTKTVVVDGDVTWSLGT
jgi:hypothetical protein